MVEYEPGDMVIGDENTVHVRFTRQDDVRWKNAAFEDVCILAPCPFCGGQSHAFTPGLFSVECVACKAAGPVPTRRVGDTIEDILNRGAAEWNRRSNVSPFVKLK